MLVDELKEQLKSLEPNITTIKAFWDHSKNEDIFKKLETLSNTPNFWQHPQQASLSKQLQRIRTLRKRYNHVLNTYTELSELIDLFEKDEKELQKLKIELQQLHKTIATLKINLLLRNPQDNSSCFLTINPGAGGTESQDWASILLRMYIRFCERYNLKVDIVDHQSGDEAGIKSATLHIKGTNSYGLLKSEHGVHRLVRISPFDTNKRRHTSFAAVFLTPEEPTIEVTVDPKDLRIDTYRASGAGGQHVNKTDSAVRITHMPTNIVVQCQNQRSQTQNKTTAMKMLIAKLAQKLQEEQDAKRAQVEKKKIEWGSQIRSYVLHPYKMVKDHRTNFESPQPDKILDGELINFIERYLVLSAQ